MNTTSSSRHPGFTLVELIVTLAVTTILIAIAVPAGQAMLGRASLGSEANLLQSHLHLARSEAVKRGSDVVLCPAARPGQCDKTIEWQSGYMVFVDLDSDGNFDPGESLLHVQQPAEKRIRIRSAQSANGRKKIRYQPNGMARGYTATFTLCDPGGQIPPKAVIISNTGRPRVSDQRSDGSAIDCS